MLRRPLPLLALLTASIGASLSTGCSAPSVRLSPRVAFVDIGGDFASVDSGDPLVGSSTASLGLGDTETIFIPRADFEFGPFQWVLDYGDLSFTGNGTAEAEINIGGVTINADAPVSSEISLALYRSTFLWDFIPSDTLDVSLGFGIGGAEVSATIDDPLNNDPAETSEEFVPLPYAAAGVGASFGNFGVEGLVGVFAIEVDDVEAQYLDVDANAYWQFVDVAGAGLRFMVGLRYISVTAEYDDGSERVEADLDFTGPYVGLTLVL